MGEQPLSCSGTPEGIRCLGLCFSFLLSTTFFLPLRFCLLRVFFRGTGRTPWTQAVVGHATLLCSEEKLKREMLGL